MKESKVRHWLHIILSVITCGLWLPAYGLIVSFTELHNRVIRTANAEIRAAYGRGLTEGEGRRLPGQPGYTIEQLIKAGWTGAQFDALRSTMQ